MALSAGGASAIEAGAQFAAAGLFGRSTRRAAKRTEKESQKLIRLQQEEQFLRNQVLKAQIGDSDRTLPHKIASPGKTAPLFGHRILPVGGPEPVTTQAGLLGTGAIGLFLIGGIILLLFALPGPP